MKLVSLNVWGGRIYKELIKFLERERESTDIFCLQEVLHYELGKPTLGAIEVKLLHQPHEYLETPDLFPKLETTLSDFDAFLSEPVSSGMERLATFVRKDSSAKMETLQVHGPVLANLHGNPYYSSCLLQHIHLEMTGKDYDVANTHGIWQSSGKEDTPDRLEQSKEMIRILSRFGSRKVLCGDFNLLPNNLSVRILEESMRNLVKENEIKSTRSSFYKKYPRYADYVFTSPEIDIVRFEVLQDEVSDHLPLLLEFH